MGEFNCTFIRPSDGKFIEALWRIVFGLAIKDTLDKKGQYVQSRSRPRGSLQHAASKSTAFTPAGKAANIQSAKSTIAPARHKGDFESFIVS